MGLPRYFDFKKASGGSVEDAEQYFLRTNYIGQEKFDGIRVIVQRDLPEDGGMTRVYTRVAGKNTGIPGDKSLQLPHIVKQVEAMFPTGTVLDGEIIVPRSQGPSHSTKVTKVTGASPEKALAYQDEHGYVEFAVFDCLAYDGDVLTDLPLTARLNAIDALRTDPSEHVFLAPYVAGEGRKRALLRKVWKNGGEGLILKDVTAPYNPKRDEAWVKVKAERRFDVVVMGFEDAKETSTKKSGTTSKTKYAGQVGAIIFGQYTAVKDGMFERTELVRYGTASGFDDALRLAMTQEPEGYIGRVITIKAQERLESGAFRHPRFVEFREDKHADECVFRTDES